MTDQASPSALKRLKVMLFNEQVYAYLSVLVALGLGLATYWLLSSEAYLQGNSEWAALLLGVMV